MKSKKSKKKLVFEKITITQLGKDIIHGVKSGIVIDTENDDCPVTQKTMLYPQCFSVKCP